jgi:anti-sigma-K factor RskA
MGATLLSLRTRRVGRVSEAEGALRRKVEETQAKVEELREEYAKSVAKGKPDERVGRRLETARAKASEAAAALWAAAPGEKPPTQRVM